VGGSSGRFYLPQVAVLACVCREERGATCHRAASTFFNPMLLFSPRSRVTPTIAAGEPVISLRGDELNMGFKITFET